jgi:hypothetical protein
MHAQKFPLGSMHALDPRLHEFFECGGIKRMHTLSVAGLTFAYPGRFQQILPRHRLAKAAGTTSPLARRSTCL